MEEYLESSMFMAALEGDTTILNDAIIAKQGAHKYLLRTPDVGNNIIHIASRRQHLHFIEQAVARFPNLLLQKNNNGNTPLHEAAHFGNKATINLLIFHLNFNDNSNDDTVAASYLWEMNDDGDTPFHVALRCRNMDTAEGLFAHVKSHPQILVFKNSSGETPLHLYVRFCAGNSTLSLLDFTLLFLFFVLQQYI